MSTSVIVYSLCSNSIISPSSLNCCKNQALTHSQFLSSQPLFNFKMQNFPTNVRVAIARTHKRRYAHRVFALQSNFLNVFRTVWKVGKDGIEAGTNMVPDSIPRPIARVSVTIVLLSVALFALKSFLSTAFFVLATMGLVYFMFIAFNRNEEPKIKEDTTPMEDPVEEARKIMEKYK